MLILSQKRLCFHAKLNCSRQADFVIAVPVQEPGCFENDIIVFDPGLGRLDPSLRDKRQGRLLDPGNGQDLIVGGTLWISVINPVVSQFKPPAPAGIRKPL